MPLSRRDLARAALISGAAAACLNTPYAAAAKTALAGRQVPGAHRLRVGSIEVTALSDGYVDLDPKLLPQADPGTVADLLEAQWLPPGKIRGSVNAFAVNTGDTLILIDTGGRDLLGPTLGGLQDALTAAGLPAEAVDAVYLTHMHPDHIGGLVSADGAAMFPNAEIVVSERDWAFWISDDVMAQAPESARAFFMAAREAIAPYADRLVRFSPERPLLSGLIPEPLPGHTPGHTGFIVEDGGESLLIWGDIVHAPPVQFAHPDWAIAFDIDQDAAIATRKRMFDRVATDRLQVAGMHLPFPGFGRVVRRGTGYEYVPTPWQFDLSQ